MSKPNGTDAAPTPKRDPEDVYDPDQGSPVRAGIDLGRESRVKACRRQRRS